MPVVSLEEFRASLGTGLVTWKYCTAY